MICLCQVVKLEINSSGTLDPAHVRSLAVLENFIGWDDTPTGSCPPPRISNDIVTEQALFFFCPAAVSPAAVIRTFLH
jgi:hypothetical protein